MTITKEQLREWERMADSEKNPPGEWLANIAQLAYTAGAEAKLRELCEGVEMPEPVGYVDDYYSSCYYTSNTPTNRYRTLKPTYTLDQLRTAVEAAVAREREACAKLQIELMMSLSKQQELAIACEELRAERDALTADSDTLKGELDKCVAAARAALEATK